MWFFLADSRHGAEHAGHAGHPGNHDDDDDGDVDEDDDNDHDNDGVGGDLVSNPLNDLCIDIWMS